MTWTRRKFCGTTALGVAATLRAQSPHIDVAVVERPHALAEAAAALATAPRTIRSIPAPHKDIPAGVFYSDGDATALSGFRTHALQLTDTSAIIAALTAAFVLTKEDRYALAAGRHLWAWFVSPDSRMEPTLSAAGSQEAASNQLPRGVIDAVALAEIARSIQFLVDTAALSPPDLAVAKDWFHQMLGWLTSDRSALIQRDAKDHVASAWLFITSAAARLVGDVPTLDDCRRRFRKPTLRNQINPTGQFLHEVPSAYPYQNSLFNFDLLAGCAELLATPFTTPWTDELEDGPSLRAVAAYLYPFLRSPGTWPFLADATHFRDVPRRRPALLFAGRAFTRPEYIELWQSLAPMGASDALRATMPIRQPLLWTTRAPHGA